jgi:hypothetical protein
MESLTEKVLRYQRTGEGLRDIVGELAPRVYHFPRRTMGWDEDACGEFYVFVHPRILRLVERFRDQGKPFESYLWAVLNWQLRNFAREQTRKEREWRVSLRMGEETGTETAGGMDEAAGRCGGAPRLSAELQEAITTPADRRNFLFLVLKCSQQLDPSTAAPLAALAGIETERLLDHAAALRALRAGREVRLVKFRSRRNRAFAKVLLLETELRREVEPQKIAALRAALLLAGRRMRSAADRMGRVGMSPTNREIALILGIPKGTVDSGLYWLKKKLGTVYDPDTLRSA